MSQHYAPTNADRDQGGMHAAWLLSGTMFQCRMIVRAAVSCVCPSIPAARNFVPGSKRKFSRVFGSFLGTAFSRRVILWVALPCPPLFRNINLVRNDSESGRRGRGGRTTREENVSLKYCAFCGTCMVLRHRTAPTFRLSVIETRVKYFCSCDKR